MDADVGAVVPGVGGRVEPFDFVLVRQRQRGGRLQPDHRRANVVALIVEIGRRSEVRGAAAGARALTVEGAFDHRPALGIAIEVPGLAGQELPVGLGVLQAQGLGLGDRRDPVSGQGDFEHERVAEGQAAGREIEAGRSTAALRNTDR